MDDRAGGSEGVHGRADAVDLSDTPDPPKDQFLLVRHRPKEERGRSRGTRDVILTYGLEPGMRVRGFAAAPDGSHFLVTVDGVRPQLLRVPARADVSAKDVEAVGLGWK